MRITRTTNYINSNVGRVVQVIKGGQRIIIAAARGGRFECQNKGFGLGEVLCYTFDTVTKQIVNLMPKALANAAALIAGAPDLQLASEGEGHGTNNGEVSERSEVAVPSDSCSRGAGMSDGELLEWCIADSENPDAHRSGDWDQLEDERGRPFDLQV